MPQLGSPVGPAGRIQVEGCRTVHTDWRILDPAGCIDRTHCAGPEVAFLADIEAVVVGAALAVAAKEVAVVEAGLAERDAVVVAGVEPAVLVGTHRNAAEGCLSAFARVDVAAASEVSVVAYVVPAAASAAPAAPVEAVVGHPLALEQTQTAILLR